jgi:hypothetical protein
VDHPRTPEDLPEGEFHVSFLRHCDGRVRRRARNRDAGGPAVDAAAIESATGLEGSYNAAEKVFKVSKPRDDVKVSVDGRALAAARRARRALPRRALSPQPVARAAAADDHIPVG